MGGRRIKGCLCPDMMSGRAFTESPLVFYLHIFGLYIFPLMSSVGSDPFPSRSLNYLLSCVFIKCC